MILSSLRKDVLFCVTTQTQDNAVLDIQQGLVREHAEYKAYKEKESNALCWNMQN